MPRFSLYILTSNEVEDESERVRQEGENNGVRTNGEAEMCSGRGGGGKGKKEKEGKALLLSLSRLKSRISLTWKSDLSNPPPHLPMASPTSNTNSLITVTGHAAQAKMALANTRALVPKVIRCTQSCHSGDTPRRDTAPLSFQSTQTCATLPWLLLTCTTVHVSATDESQPAPLQINRCKSACDI